MRLVAIALAASFLGACGGDDREDGSGGEVAAAVAEQLRYLDPQSSTVVAIDVRWKGENWKAFRPIVDRMLAASRDADPDEQSPGSVQAALEQALRYEELSFSDDVEPALDGHLVIGARGHEAVLVYRTREGDLTPLAQAIDGSVQLRPLEGYDDTVVTSDSSLAVVGMKTAVLVWGPGNPGTAMRAALSRAEQGDGVPAARLVEAERDVGLDDPLLLATGDLTAAPYLIDVEERGLERARESVPYLRALRRGSVAVEADDEGLEGRLRLVTDREELSARDLPVGPAGELELPEDDEASVLGANRDQSHTTTFGAKVARALYADSRFVRAVERAEKELGISFEDEVLRQFDCPSVSVLEPPDERSPGRFAARSCVNDPDRMRELLPRLAPHLPAILNGLDALGSRGLTGLLLLAPDAPLVPGVALGQIDVQPLGGDEEELYEITSPPRAGADRMVFGLVGDSFVVATDEEMARRAAELDTEALDEDAAGAVRVPVADLLQLEGDDVQPFADVFEPLEATISAEPGATVATARLDLRD